MEDFTTTNEMPPRKFRWYALQTTSNYEARVQKVIQGQAKGFGVELLIGRILFPVENVREIHNGKEVIRQRKLYPGYLFVELDLYDEQGELRMPLWQFVRNIPGVFRFVGAEKPAPLQQAEVDEILYQAESKDKKAAVSQKMYEVGTLVKITDGPFAGASGEVESIDEAMGILRISVGLFGRKTPVDLEFWQVRKEEV